MSAFHPEVSLTVLFHFIQCCVCTSAQGYKVFALVWIGGAAGADGKLCHFSCGQGQRGKPALEFLHIGIGFLLGGTFQTDYKFIASVAAQDAVFREAFFHNAGTVLQAQISVAVAVGVIVGFEVVDIYKY